MLIAQPSSLLYLVRACLHPTYRAFTLTHPLNPGSQRYTTVVICVLESIIPLVRAARIGPIPPFGGFVAWDMVGGNVVHYMISSRYLICGGPAIFQWKIR